MKKLHFVCMAIAMMFVLISSAQSPTEGYVLYVDIPVILTPYSGHVDPATGSWF